MGKIVMQVTVEEHEDGLEIYAFLEEPYDMPALEDILGQYLEELSIESEGERSPGWGRP